MKVAVIGKGNVGKALAPRIHKAAGHSAIYGVRDPSDPKYDDGDGVPLATVADAARGADALIFAVHWGAVDSVLAECGPIGGKILIDCTNPLDFANGLAWQIPDGTSGAEIIAGKSDARVVKAFNQVGADAMAQAGDYGMRPLQFAAGDDGEAKAKVLGLMSDIGFDARDAGPLGFARDLESMARLWIGQAFAGMDGATAWALMTPGR
ncbi:MAG TPA: NAD(P)-binding domain-containing protein [Allosphingosinicella sp.]|nr:NAD(P)-binding domain-containing protein [Allosphingosinicella sp.]